MHPEIEEIINTTDFEFSAAAWVMVLNAGHILDYMDDIYLERTGKFEYTPADTLYIRWDVEDLEFHIECLKNGRVQYTFRKNGRGTAFGADMIDQFIPRMQNYLLAGIR